MAVLERLFAVIEQRKGADPASSYTAKLLHRGPGKIAQKFGEEAVETIIAATSEGREELAAESADLLYHLLVLWAAHGLRPEEVWARLAAREGISGVSEKASRKGV
ncbi:MAG: phosphoribosyl-ATP diphosphatase [Tistlia sp.]|uniref:phosphoribosyl-ATP diphosphatase n=1 Tax=Tistlia sp. TaxID=3057121 RepID=UPI0034A56F60